MNVIQQKTHEERTGRAQTPLLQSSLVRVTIITKPRSAHKARQTRVTDNNGLERPQCTGSRLPGPPRVTGFTLIIPSI